MLIKLLKRYQEFIGWLPLLVLMSLVGWAVLGGLDRSIGGDFISKILDFAILSIYAFGAVGLSHFARRRMRHKLTEEQKKDLFKKVLENDPGAVRVYIVENVCFIIVFLSCLFSFFHVL